MDIKKIKQRLDSNPELNAASKRLAELQQALQAAQEAHKASEARLHASFVTTDDARALALIGGHETQGVNSLREAEVRDRERVTLYKRAIELHKQALNQLHCEVSSAICRELRGEHAKLGDAIADAALRLQEANKQEMAFRNQLEEAGVRGGLPALVFLYFETLGGSDSPMDR